MHQKRMATKKCAACGNDAKKLKACAECLKTKYCSEKCQWDDWATHKEKCKKIEMPKRKAGEQDDDDDDAQTTRKAESQNVDDAQKRLEEIEKEQEKLESEKKRLLKKSRLKMIAKKKQDIARFKGQIDTARKKLAAAEVELEDLREQDRDDVAENALNEAEETELKAYLKSLKQSYEGINLIDAGEGVEYANYVFISIESPKSLNISFSLASFNSSVLIGAPAFIDAFNLTNWDKKKAEKKLAAHQKKEEFPPPKKIVDLMKRARVTLTGGGKTLKYAPGGQESEDVGDEKTWGYKSL